MSQPYLEIVSHCWNYSRIASYQLSSLVLYPPPFPLTYTLFYAESDRPTVSLVDFFRDQTAQNVTWNFKTLDPPSLCRRAIGRNTAALETRAEWVWFADVDMAFRGDSLGRFRTGMDGVEARLVYPAWIYKTNHTNGDFLVEKASGPPTIRDVDPMLFEKHKYNRAIGGVQIIHGDVCREKGYCRDLKKYQTPVRRWRRTFEDKAIRGLLKTKGHRILGLDVYRIAHSKQGRFHPGVIL